MTEASTQSPVFVLGIAQRSGTNFLLDLLALHPDLAPAKVNEDFFVAYSDDLTRYAARVTKRWLAEWGSREMLLQAIGEGLLRGFAGDCAPRRPLLKTPSTANLRNVFELFPTARVLVIVRDGRSVAESSVESFKMDAEAVARRWSAAAIEVARIEKECLETGKPLTIVRYENLVGDSRSELTRILRFLDLDVDRYDFERAASLPVRGSGTMKSQAGKVHWTQVERDASFRPLERFVSWTADRHDRFNWLASDGMRALGYQMQPISVPAWRWRSSNRWRDFRDLPFPRARRIVRAFLDACQR